MTIAFALLPTSLLFEAIFGDITRTERIEYLSIGFALILLYSYEAQAQQGANNYTQRSNRSKDGSECVRVFPESFCSKYLELTYSLINQLALNTRIHLGSLGSHKLEHFFGLIRRLTYDDYSPQAFERITRKALLYKSLCKTLNCSIKIDKRKSDSGSKLEKDTDAPILLPFAAYLSTAFSILNDCGIPLFYENLGKSFIENYKS